MPRMRDINITLTQCPSEPFPPNLTPCFSGNHCYPMDSFPDGNHPCVCGRSFLQLSALSYHRRQCSTTKKCFSGALYKAREVWINRKKHCLEMLRPGVAGETDIFRSLAMDVAGSRIAIDGEVRVYQGLFLSSTCTDCSVANRTSRFHC